MHAKLTPLFCSLFDSHGLRRFIRSGPEGEELAHHFPGTEAPLVYLADAVVDQLIQRGLIVETLIRLRNNYSHRSPDIDAVAQSSGLDINFTPFRPTDSPSDKISGHLDNIRSGASTPRLVGTLLAGSAMLDITVCVMLASKDILPSTMLGTPTTAQVILAFFDIVLGASLCTNPCRILIAATTVRLSLVLSVSVALGVAHNESATIILNSLVSIGLLILLFRGPKGNARIFLATALLLPYSIAVILGIVLTAMALGEVIP